ncbi:MAG TPA: lysine--tRNA ligase [Candidatus Portnoybacteria bacterium]|jgi:lysyl-tRNA synthetase, class II|nr:lysine--tRNA ligase [Candidatus Portnoybacteria bacterium]MDD5752049.1 lysine--tRNA ligase [Candidatus Portnoybacteria bacterium]HOZ16399.1 lysine--tRNA ligase [Candidatus Portnoybacteria bacterium]HPH52051.1 lysine--tRNA ligase [Candidatus Portnoybacteria bacterium]HPJ80200.1 lysine--tRNA ligase [Candidatus Portnoybacteria bacterium]
MDNLEEIRKIRIQKLENFKKMGMNPYTAIACFTHTNAEALDNFKKLSGVPDKNGVVQKSEEITLVGRVRSLRGHGGSTFCHIEDGSTTLTASGKIQLYLKKDLIGDANYDLFINNIDLGDFIEVKGKLFLTQKGEKTLQVFSWKILTKAILPLPSEWYGLEDVEERSRKRYLDLIMNKEVRDKFLKRSKIIKEIRKFLEENGFLEVETPMLQTMAGGAKAKPFKTHLNALDMDLYLRIAPELYLKRLLVGGFDKVYELNRNFRNEGMDREHNPEFTMLEFYAAYWNYEIMMDFTEKLLNSLNNKLFQRPFKRIEYEKIVKNGDEKGAFGKIKESTFVINHPVEISPLAKKLNEKQAARFQLIVNGIELANGFSELNDPADQAERFKAQEIERKSGNEEAHQYDKDFVEALEYGMPPASGIGIGIDRLTVLLTDSKTLREIILFPTMKPKENE